jgi:hypothetical protein
MEIELVLETEFLMNSEGHSPKQQIEAEETSSGATGSYSCLSIWTWVYEKQTERKKLFHHFQRHG